VLGLSPGPGHPRWVASTSQPLNWGADGVGGWVMRGAYRDGLLLLHKPPLGDVRIERETLLRGDLLAASILHRTIHPCEWD
jgi:hypothetical protein